MKHKPNNDNGQAVVSVGYKVNEHTRYEDDTEAQRFVHDHPGDGSGHHYAAELVTIAAAFGVSKQRIDQIIQEALKALKFNVRAIETKAKPEYYPGWLCKMDATLDRLEASLDAIPDVAEDVESEWEKLESIRVAAVTCGDILERRIEETNNPRLDPAKIRQLTLDLLFGDDREEVLYEEPKKNHGWGG